MMMLSLSSRETAMDIKIRDAVAADWPAIVEIYNAAVPTRLATADLDPITVESRQEWFAKHDPHSRPLWVLELNGDIAAWICLSSFYSGRSAYRATAEISIYIAPRYQGRGYGSMLVRRLVEECPRLGVKTLVAMYFDHNSASRSMFKKLGFQEAGHLTEIAELDDETRGLIIALFRVPPKV